jgi:GNAT superfamily N-acetyltransferase
MPDYIIRIANRDDAGTLAKFNTAMAWETEAKKLAPELITAGVNKLFDEPDAGFYTVVEADSRVIAALMITTEWSDWRNGFFWWIQSVYVEPEYRGQGIFTGLYEHIKDRAKSAGNVCGLRLYVEKENQRAQRTYIKTGMLETHYRLYEEEF